MVLKFFNDDELIESAMKAYFLKYGKADASLMLPGTTGDSSFVTSKYVYLGNGAHLLAVYDFRNEKFTEVSPRMISYYKSRQ